MQLWENFLHQLEKELGSEVVQKWLRPLKVQRFDAGNLYLEAKDYFQALWFEEHVRAKATLSLFNNNSRPIKIHLSIANTNSQATDKKTKARKVTKDNTQNSQVFTLTFDTLDPYCTIENFHSSDANKMAYKVICELVGYDPEKKVLNLLTKKDPTFNPVYIHGPSGTGKTHLLMSAAHILRQQGLDVIYTRAETFTEHVVNAIRSGEMSAFRRRYRHIDCLLIDDVHVFSRKGATQEELFHTFNTLHLAGKQIILSSSCAPQELQLIEPRLVSRFEWGLVISIDHLPATDLENILSYKTKALNYPLHSSVMQFLIEAFPSGSASMMRALKALMLRAHLGKDQRDMSSTTISVATAKHCLADLLQEESKNALTPEKVIQTVASFYDIRAEDIQGSSKSRECAVPRQVAMYFCRTKLGMPFMKIGDLFSRDHSTVMSSVKRIQESQAQKDQAILHALHVITKKL
jgi:chromosomal replication initiator protein